MKTTTLNVLVLSAQDAANKAFAGANAVEQQTIKLDAFKAAGFDPLDFATWENTFHDQLQMLVNFSRHESPATIAAKKRSADGSSARPK